MGSAEVIARIRAENYGHHRGDAEAIPQIHSVESMCKRSSTVANFGESESKRQDKWCSNGNCNRKKGHTIEECLAYGGGRCGQYPEWWTWRRDIHLPPNQRQKSTKTSKHGNTPRSNAVQASDIIAVDTPAEVAAVLTQDEPYYAFNSFIGDPGEQITCNIIAFQASTTNDSHIYHDSGANRHIFFNISHFDNYRAIAPLSVKGFESSVTTSAVGVGDVLLRVHCNGKSSVIKLSDVLHVPSARLNLVSQGCLARRGMSLRESHGKMILSAGHNDIITAHLTSNNLYRLDAVPAKQSLQDRISPPSLASRISDKVEPLAFKAGTREGRKVSSDFYTA